jgi:CheY-like chemotaxis protein
MTSKAKGRILVVDDMDSWRKLIPSILPEYDVVTVGTYADAVRVIESYDFDVAVLDIRLEDEDSWNVDGVSLMRHVREHKPHAGMVIFTGYLESVRQQLLIEYSPDQIISKNNFDNRDFREAIDRIVAFRGAKV